MTIPTSMTDTILSAMGKSDDSGTLVSFLGALQASLAVLLTISYGVIASRWKLLSDSSARDISKTCVRLFLPALLITNIGSELDTSTVGRYVPILIWALVYTLLSMALGQLLKKMFKFPAWTVPAICFNNTTALPLLLVQSLESAGILDSLLKSDSDTTSDAVKRAKSYFLVSAVVGNALTFTMGPKLLDDEESPDASEGDESKPLHDQNPHRLGDEEEANAEEPSSTDNDSEDDGPANETTTLLPRPLDGHVLHAIGKATSKTNHLFEKLPSWLQKSLSFAGQFVNAPIVGAVIGAFLGLTPGVNTWFFAKPDEGGVLKAWLTQSIENIGDLFATLQLVVVGSKLSASLAKAKKGEDSGKVDWKPLVTIFFIRFLMWPAISISLVYLVASKTSWLTPDPILWFVMMLMPTGPPATKLTALADVSGAEEKQKLAISKFLTISYAASPIICIAVVGSLKASKAIMESQGMQ